jgi:hypothetical protein
MINKSVIVITVLLVILLAAGCKTTTPAPATSTISSVVKSVQLASKWQMNQMNLQINGKDDLSLLLKLAPEDKTDGYFYLEKGNQIKFDIIGNSLIYASQQQSTSARITSDRFSFSASLEQGSTYTLGFHNPEDSQVTVFMELIYPLTGSFYAPVPKD